MTGYADDHEDGYDGYGRWHLGIDQRASQNDHEAVRKAFDDLLERLDSKHEG